MRCTFFFIKLIFYVLFSKKKTKQQQQTETGNPKQITNKQTRCVTDFFPNQGLSDLKPRTCWLFWFLYLLSHTSQDLLNKGTFFQWINFWVAASFLSGFFFLPDARWRVGNERADRFSVPRQVWFKGIIPVFSILWITEIRVQGLHKM